MPSRFNHTGQRFGKLLVIAIHYHDPKQGSYWLCLCDCGNTCIPKGNSLRYGTSQSCGCVRRDRFNNATHRLSASAEYVSWVAMKQRCLNPSNKAYPNYGKRGITVCERWLYSFENFLNDMGQRPSKGLTLERRNNNKGYSPDNCYWAPRKAQQRNRRVTRYITAFGTTKSLAEWAEIYHLKASVITYRLSRGYTPEQSLCTLPFGRYAGKSTKNSPPSTYSVIVE